MKQTITTRAIPVAFALALTATTALAQQTITISGGAIGLAHVYGNGTPPDGADVPPLGDPNGNTVNFIDGSSIDINWTISGGYLYDTATGTANGNIVNVEDSTAGYINGGQVYLTGAGDATANDNTVNITNSTSTRAITGGSAYSDDGDVTANNNTVTITGGTISPRIYGGYVGATDGTGTATGNTVTIGGAANLSGARIYGGDFDGSGTAGDLWTGNTLNVNSAAASLVISAQNFEFINFGYSGNADIATLNVSPTGAAAGSLVKLDTGANNVTFTGTITDTPATPGGIEKLGTGTLTLTGNNTYTGATTVSAGTLSIGSDSNIGTGTNTLAGGTLQLTGASYAKGWTLGAGTNAIETAGTATMSGILTGSGGFAKTGAGTLTLEGTNTYTGATTVTAGTLAVTGTLGSGSYAGNISNAGELVFDQTVGQTLSGIISGTGSLTKDGAGTLTLSGANTYEGATEVLDGTLAVSGTLASPHLILNDGVTFDRTGGTLSDLSQLDVKGAVTWTGALSMGAGDTLNFFVPTTTVDGDIMLSVTDAVDITGSAVRVGINGGSSALNVGDQITLIDATGGLTADQDGTRAQGLQGIAKIFEFDLTTDADKLFATVASAQNNEQLKALSEGRAAGLAFVSQGADMIMGHGMWSLLSATKKDGLASFGAAIGGGSSRYKTGSHIDVDGVSMLVGLGWRTPGSIVAGAFFEAGWGNYNSRNSFNNAPSVKGKGDTSYYGGGVLGRYEAPTGMYAEASLRAGRVKNDFRSSDILNSDSDTTKYDSGSAYYGAHAGLGYVWNMNEKASLDMSTRYIWTHQASDSVTISGDRIKFKDADSQ
ncbi:MAG: autotransporter-associated beta strand repeat-containing protein, partial [Betaproteobacteria bacterium]|nr:autotransporter-associated beta strand repeat-containing protein [Betaproteobacteria bacterium]